MLVADGGCPFTVLAVNRTSVPPTRSMPSFGVCRLPKNTIEYKSARIAARARK